MELQEEAKRRKLFNEALNDDFQSLSRVIADYNGPIDFVGACGESPLHIAIYKQNVSLLSVLLKRGADPNFKNKFGDTGVHVATRIGAFKCLKELYSCGRCDLEIVNRSKETALDIACSYPTVSDVSLIQLYSTWDRNRDLERETRRIVKEREKSEEFLRIKMAEDRRNLTRKLVISSIDHSDAYLKQMHIIRGGSERIGDIQMSSYRHPFGFDNGAWNNRDILALESNAEDRREVYFVSFSRRYVSELLWKAFDNVSIQLCVSKSIN